MSFKRRAIIAGAALLLAAGPAGAQQPNTPARIAEILASPDRSAADRTNDQRRKPADMLAFIAIVPGITALDLLNKEVKRRTHAVGIFLNEDAIVCLVDALMLDQND